MHKSIITASLLCSLSSFTHAQDRFASLVEGAGESIVTSGGSYAAEVPGAITQEEFIEAMYTSPLFKLERMMLRVLAARTASGADAKQLAAGDAVAFSVWRVEGQSASELLLADFTGQIRSWLMATSATGSSGTLFRFGSAVVPRQSRGVHKPGLGWGFHALLGFHRLYSRLLLAAASKRVGRA